MRLLQKKKKKRAEEIERMMDPFMDFLILALEKLEMFFKSVGNKTLKEVSDISSDMVPDDNESEEDLFRELEEIMEKSGDLFGFRE